MRRVSHQPAHLWDQEDYMRLSPITFLRTEPGGHAQSDAHSCTVDQHGEPAC